MSSLCLNPDDTKKVRTYSLGMKQKVGIAAAIMEHPDLIVLDEPFNGLDENSVEKLTEILLALKDEKRIIIISCHDRQRLNLLCDEIFRIDGGRVVEHFVSE